MLTFSDPSMSSMATKPFVFGFGIDTAASADIFSLRRGVRVDEGDGVDHSRHELGLEARREVDVADDRAGRFLSKPGTVLRRSLALIHPGRAQRDVVAPVVDSPGSEQRLLTRDPEGLVVVLDRQLRLGLLRLLGQYGQLAGRVVDGVVGPARQLHAVQPHDLAVLDDVYLAEIERGLRTVVLDDEVVVVVTGVEVVLGVDRAVLVAVRELVRVVDQVRFAARRVVEPGRVVVRAEGREVRERQEPVLAGRPRSGPRSLEPTPMSSVSSPRSFMYVSPDS